MQQSHSVIRLTATGRVLMAANGQIPMTVDNSIRKLDEGEARSSPIQLAGHTPNRDFCVRQPAAADTAYASTDSAGDRRSSARSGDSVTVREGNWSSVRFGAATIWMWSTPTGMLNVEDGGVYEQSCR